MVSLIPKKPTAFETVPPGTYLGICYQIVDLGHQKTTYNGEVRQVHKIRMSWELPHETMADGRPMAVSKEYTFSLSKNAHLRSDLEAWRAKPFTDEELGNVDLAKLLGFPAFITVVHKEGKN